jgi:hypothetical protein
MVVTARVSTFTDSDHKSQVLGWIGNEAKEWFCALLIYDTAISPGHQFWKYKVNDGKVFNANIVTNPELNEAGIQKACRVMAARAPDSAFLVIVTAFKKEETDRDYDFGHQGKRWQLLINRSKNIDEFRDMTLDLGDELRFANELGLKTIETGKEIPADWFGNTGKSQELGKLVWALDSDKELFEHPYVFESTDIFNLELSLAKRLPASREYKKLTKELFNLIHKNLDKYRGITVSLNFRGTGDYLVDFYFIAETKSLSYKDTYMEKPLYYKPSSWLDPN